MIIIYIWRLFLFLFLSGILLYMLGVVIRGVVFRLFLFFVLALGVSSGVYAITDPSIKEQQYGIDLYLEASNLDYTPPDWFRPVHHSQASESFEYRVHEVLPYEQDRYEDIYLVIPGLGLVAPIQQIPQGTPDYDKMVNGKEIEINNYLIGGIIEYVNSVSPGYRGKRVDFGHSNYYKTDSGRYKTIFANLMAVDINDQVWYFVRQNDGSYKLFKYLVTASYPTNPSNVQALQRDGDGSDALIFGCYHGLDGRWMIEASYIGEPIGQPVEEKDVYDTIPAELKNRIRGAMKKITFMEERKQGYTIVQFFRQFESVRERLQTGNDMAYKLLLLDYIEELLAGIYPETL